MNGNTFSFLGYLSVLLWLGVPVLWLIRLRFKRSQWLCPAALVLALIALVFAKINSETHVNRIEPDRSAQMAEQQAALQAKRKAAEETRGDAVADVRFAEDGATDFLDKAGMDEAELKYMERSGAEAEPEWRKTKKRRGASDKADGSLDSVLGGDEAVQGVDATALEKEEELQPILMSEAGMAMAHRLDGLNLTVIRILILLAVLMLVIDYLARINVHAQAVMPLPLPSAWANLVTPIPPVVARSTPVRRDIVGELAWLAKRGDCFVCLTDNAAEAARIPSSLPRLGKKWLPVDVLRVDGDRITDDFVFEGLWYGRSCFVVDSSDRAIRLFSRFIDLLEERKKVRARVSQTVHVVWDLKSPLSQQDADAFEKLAKTTGFSLFLCHSNN